MFCCAIFEIRTVHLQKFPRGGVRLGEQFPTFRKMVVHLISWSGTQRRVYFSRKILLYLHQWRDGQDMQHVYLEKINIFAQTRKNSCQHSDGYGKHEELCYKF